MACRGKNRLTNCLDRLIQDLGCAQDGVLQIRDRLNDGTATQSDVSSCYMALSGFMEDFSDEISGFLGGSISSGQPTATTTSVTAASPPPSRSSSTSAAAAGVRSPSVTNDSKLTEVLRRLQNLECLQTETTVFQSESEKAQRELSLRADEFDEKLNFLQSKQKQTQANAETESSQLEERMSNFEITSSKLKGSVSKMESMHRQLSHGMTAIGDGLSELKKKTLSTQTDVHSIKLGLSTADAFSRKDRDTVAKMSHRVNQLETKAEDLVKLRQLLNRLHLKLQNRKEKADKPQCSAEAQRSAEMVAFKASLDTEDDEESRGTVMDLTRELYLNVGNAFNADGMFRAPLKGMYFLMLTFGQDDDGELEMDVKCNGKWTGYNLNVRTTGNFDKRTGAALVELEEGDLVEVGVWYASGDASIKYCFFSGFLLG